MSAKKLRTDRVINQCISYLVNFLTIVKYDKAIHGEKLNFSVLLVLRN